MYQYYITEVRKTVSGEFEHGAILFTSTCYPIKHECYAHGVEEVSEE